MPPRRGWGMGWRGWLQDFASDGAAGAGARPPCLQRAQAFLQAFPERAPDGHRLAHAFHLRGQRRVGLREFLEGKPRNFRDDVVNARIEARGGLVGWTILIAMNPLLASSGSRKQVTSKPRMRA